MHKDSGRDSWYLRQIEESELYYQQQREYHIWHHDKFVKAYNGIREMLELMTLIAKHMSYKEEFETWLATRPQVVQDLATKYPPGDYKIKEGAPYGVTAPGCTVNIQSYREDGQVGVLIRAKDKSEAAINHEKMLGAQYQKTPEEMEEIHAADVMAHVDPQWLELVHNEAG